MENNIYKHEEHQYINLIQNIIDNGHLETGRNGITKSIFGYMMRFSLRENKIPILTTKKVAWKTCLKELFWFIKGDTNNKHLQQQNVHIWDANSSKEFMHENRGLTQYADGLIGPCYGFQWRHFNAPYDTNTGNPLINTNEKFTDQLNYIIEQLKNPATRNSRRLIMTAWNPNQLEMMSLPPCHLLCQFNVHNGKYLSCSLYQRSCDVGLGASFNIASYSFLTHLLAKHCGLEPFEFIHFIGNAHIYESHLEPLQRQINNIPFEFPTLEITNLRENIEDYTIEDFIINNYKSYENIKMDIVP